jgi:hypothetical protein
MPLSTPNEANMTEAAVPTAATLKPVAAWGAVLSMALCVAC